MIYCDVNKAMGFIMSLLRLFNFPKTSCRRRGCVTIRKRTLFIPSCRTPISLPRNAVVRGHPVLHQSVSILDSGLRRNDENRCNSVSLITTQPRRPESGYITGFRIKSGMTGFACLIAGLMIAVVILVCSAPGYAYPVSFQVDGKKITLAHAPVSVVSLVPSVTEILFKLGAGDAVTGLTYHDADLPGAGRKTIVGGFFKPSVETIETLNPDMIFVSGIHEEVKKKFGGTECLLISMETLSISQSLKQIELVGKIFEREAKAAQLVSDIQDQLAVVAKKISLIPSEKRKRVMRLMGLEKVMTPGTDSFQNEMIRAAGGITHDFNRNGSIIDVSLDEWLRFNPQVLYGCGIDEKKMKSILETPGWKEVDAVKNGQVFSFPCDLTCRASTNTGYFVSWLAARIYGEEFSKDDHLVLKENVFETKPVDLDLSYVKDARIAYSHIKDFVNKTLIIEFKTPMSVVSTLEGQREGIRTVGNHFAPLPCWCLGHDKGLEGQREQVCRVVRHAQEDSCFLFTGADMDHMAIVSKKYRDLEVVALVTAGVRMNAMRMGEDEGNFYEPGTINMILLSNMKLSPRAMTRAVITATEAKTAALQDMDIRSSFSPMAHQATGTGTDNMIVVQGTGKAIENAGGHSRLGELIARAVYDGVKEAVYKQNGLIPDRNVLQRLNERGISIYELLSLYECECGVNKFDMVNKVENLLLKPEYASFVCAALALSDDYERGQVPDLQAFDMWCERIVLEIAGTEIREPKDFVQKDGVPPVIKKALNTIMNGIYYRDNPHMNP